MKSILIFLALLVIPVSYVATAGADDGSGSGSSVTVPTTGSGSAATPAPVGSAGSAAAPTSAIHNPAADPVAYISDLQEAKKVGWPLFILVGVFGLCELLAAAGSKIAWMAWLGKGRISVVIAGLCTLTTSMIAAIAGGAAWTAVLLGAAVPAIALFAHPAGTDPAKA